MQKKGAQATYFREPHIICKEPHVAREPRFGHPWYMASPYCVCSALRAWNLYDSAWVAACPRDKNECVVAE